MKTLSIVVGMFILYVVSFVLFFALTFILASSLSDILNIKSTLINFIIAIPIFIYPIFFPFLFWHTFINFGKWVTDLLQKRLLKILIIISTSFVALIFYYFMYVIKNIEF